MPNPLKRVLLVAAIAVVAMLFGQLYYNGKPIATRIADRVGQPPRGYEVISDTSADVAYYAKALGKKIPVWFTDARVTVAKWLYPSVAENARPPRD